MFSTFGFYSFLVFQSIRCFGFSFYGHLVWNKCICMYLRMYVCSACQVDGDISSGREGDGWDEDGIGKRHQHGSTERRHHVNLRHEQLLRHRHRRWPMPRFPQSARGKPRQVQQQVGTASHRLFLCTAPTNSVQCPSDVFVTVSF